MEILIGILTIVLVIVSILLILVVLMQRGSADGGLGAAMGGGMAESALGAETSTVLSRWTRNISIVFFVLVFGLYLGRLWIRNQEIAAANATLPDLGGTSESSSAANSALQELISKSEEAKEEAPVAANEAAQSEQAVEETKQVTETPAAAEAPTATEENAEQPAEDANAEAQPQN